MTQAADAFGTARKVEDGCRYQNAFHTLRHETSTQPESSRSEDDPDVRTRKGRRANIKKKDPAAKDTPERIEK